MFWTLYDPYVPVVESPSTAGENLNIYTGAANYCPINLVRNTTSSSSNLLTSYLTLY